MAAAQEPKATLPPRWFIRLFWKMHRGIYSLSGGRIGLSKESPKGSGMMGLHTVGRRSGQERVAILAYFEDGPNFVTMAMNGWGDPEPAWWLNLQAKPDVTIDLPDGPHQVRGRAAEGGERERLWARWASYDKGLDQYAAMRSRPTQVVVFEPRA
jgi:F420H(2)-dependent quinone reductase